MSLIVTLVVLALGGAGGYYAWCYYEVLDLKAEVPHGLDRVYMFRGTARVKAEQIRKKAFDQLRARGARLAESDVRVTLAPLTVENAAKLPAMQKQKLSLACYMQRIEDVRDARIKKGINEARAGHRLTGNVPSTKPPPLKPGGPVVCAPSRLRYLDYTFVEVSATVVLKHGWVKRSLVVDRRFYLPQHPVKPKKPGEDDDGDEDDNE